MVFSGCLRRQRSFDMEPAQGRQVSTALLVGGKLLFQFQKRRRIVLNHPFLLPLGVGGVNRIALLVGFGRIWFVDVIRPGACFPITCMSQSPVVAVRCAFCISVTASCPGGYQMSHRETFEIGPFSPFPSGCAERPQQFFPNRSEERRVGKECRSRWSP